jgi:hypothetical protein
MLSGDKTFGERTTKGFTQVGLSAMAHQHWYFNQLQ